MKMKRSLVWVMISLAGSWLAAAPVFPADFEWTVTKHLKLEASPLDVAPSADGQWLFILAPGDILVYSVKDDKVVKHIAVDKGFDRVIQSGSDGTLILSSRSGQALEIIQLGPVYKIDVSGLPFKGPEHAPVTIAVFSDYQ
jgi:hypothetical protein